MQIAFNVISQSENKKTRERGWGGGGGEVKSQSFVSRPVARYKGGWKNVDEGKCVCVCGGGGGRKKETGSVGIGRGEGGQLIIDHIR